MGFTHSIKNNHSFDKKKWSTILFNFSAKKCEIQLFIVANMLNINHLSGEDGIRTHDTLLGYTHFPGVRHRPTRPPLLFPLEA